MLPILLLCFLSCQSGSTEHDTPADGNQRLTYRPEPGTLRIASGIANPEVTQVTLLNDKKRDSLATAVPQGGKFTLEVDQLPVREVYFLEVSGRSVRKGTAGLDWTEHIPVYLKPHISSLTLDYHFFDHPGSISQAKFSVEGGGDEQALLNRWQAALNTQKADIEGQAVEYTLGQRGFSGGGNEPEISAADEKEVTQQFIQPDTPLVATLFLAYIGNDHRRQVATYNALYESASQTLRQTKYGIDLIRRLDRINHPVKELHLSDQVVITDAGLRRISWADFSSYDRILLCFWDSLDKTAYSDIQAVSEQARAFEKHGTILVHVAMDNRFSWWKKASTSLDLAHNYKLRNESRQPLVDALYLTDLPRYVLTQPNGEVIDADVSPEAIRELLSQR